jgi:hypothetical protein
MKSAALNKLKPVKKATQRSRLLLYKLSVLAKSSALAKLKI